VKANKMKNLIIVWLMGFTLPYAQLKQELTVYEVVPGTTGNQIILKLANNTDLPNLENVEVKLLKGSNNLDFPVDKIIVGTISKEEEKEVSISFNVNYNTEITKRDTIVFLISGKDGIQMMKEFVFEYTKPIEYRLDNNYPNPFNPATTLRYTLPDESSVSLRVYNILGEVVSSLVNEVQNAGYYEINFNAAGYATGVYIYTLQAKSTDGRKKYNSVKKMMLIK
jgi:hypothetical protein